MHFITFALISFLFCNFAISVTIISLDAINSNAIDFVDEDVKIIKFNGKNHKNNILETVYARQSFGKSHRFLFTAGERQNGDNCLDKIFKQTGWKVKTDAIVNLTYPSANKTIKSLTYVMMTVYQESDINQIHVSDGGIQKDKITISIHANQTRYVAYNVEFYGFNN